MNYYKTYKWKCPYCLGDAIGFHIALVHYPYDQPCAFCGHYYKRRLEGNKVLVAVDDLEDLCRYLTGVYIREWEHSSKILVPNMINKFEYVKEHLRLELEHRYGWVGTVAGFINLGELFKENKKST